MADASPPLKDLLLGRIAASPGRRILFSEFMEISLFDPRCGYYTNREGKIGLRTAASDFGTYPEKAAPVFGAGLARQILDMWVGLDNPARLLVVEMGAGNGTMARATLERIRDRFPPLYAAVQYVIVDLSHDLATRQREQLAPFADEGKVRWISGSAIDLPDPDGIFAGDLPAIFLSNELPDAFPVDRLRLREGRYEIVYVASDANGELLETFGPIPGTLPYRSWLDSIRTLGAGHQRLLEEGGEIPLNFGAVRWLERLSSLLRRGYVLTIDYGSRNGEFPRGEKSVRIYGVAKPLLFFGIRITNRRLLVLLKELRWSVSRRISLLRPWSWQRRLAVRLNFLRQLKDDVDYMYRVPGEVDMTSDVDFDLLAQEGTRLGLRLERIETQAEFFARQGIGEEGVRRVHNPAFHVMIQSKGVGPELVRAGTWERLHAGPKVS